MSVIPPGIRNSPAKFRERLLIDTDRGPRPLAKCLDDWQRRDFAALDPGWRRVAGQDCSAPKLRAYLERPRGHSKTTDLAAMVVWVLIASKRPLSGVAAAADKDQAKLLRDAIDKLVRINPWLKELLDVQSYRVVNRHTGSMLEILSSDAASSWGHTPDFIIIDELSVWASRDLWGSLISAAAKRAICMVVCISNAGWSDSWQWTVREAIRTDPAWYFARLDGPVASWITADRLAEQRRLLLPIEYDRVWANQWQSGDGSNALDFGDIEAAIVSSPAGPLRPEPGWLYVAGLDIGLKKDASALVVVAKHIGHVEELHQIGHKRPVTPFAILRDLGLMEEDGSDALDLSAEPEHILHHATGKLRVCSVDIWQVKGSNSPSTTVDLESIEAQIVDLHSRLSLTAVGFDPWQAAYLSERLRKRGVTTIQTDFTPANLRSMATAVVEAFRERQIELPNDPTLLADLRKLRAVEKQYGVRLESPKNSDGGTAHGDTATGLSIALHIAKMFDTGRRNEIEGPLIVSY